VLALELFVVPLCDFGVCEQGVVATGEASLQALSDIVVERKIGAEGIVRVLPIAILRFVDGLSIVSSGQHNMLHRDTCTYKPFIHQVIIPLDNEGRIIEEVINDLTVGPSTIFIEQRKRSIPMKQHRSYLEVLLDKLGDDIVVVLHTFFVDRTFAKGTDTRPRYGEAESRHAQILQASKVLLV
jgi:hypothetical protein